MSSRAPDPLDEPAAERMRELIERSSLGTPAAKRLRESVPDEVVADIMRRVKEIQARRERRHLHAVKPEERGAAVSIYSETRTARYTPQRTDDLKPEAQAIIGQVFEFRCVGVVDWDSPYEGQRQWLPVDPEVFVGWIPDCDLTPA